MEKVGNLKVHVLGRLSFDSGVVCEISKGKVGTNRRNAILKRTEADLSRDWLAVRFFAFPMAIVGSWLSLGE